jgi:predicted nucleic acid-binding protein
VSRSRPQFADRVFVDTSAFYAASDRNNRETDSARKLITRLISERNQLVTTNFVLAELHALILTSG